MLFLLITHPVINLNGTGCPLPFAVTGYEPPGEDETNLSPTIPDMMKSKQIIRIISRDSPNKIMPIIATPTAPIPVHTAYAVPTGIDFIAVDNNQKLIAIARTVSTDGTSFENPSVYLSPIAQPHSNNPATNK
jgi:hypothetical protein